jgi:hypothetical protein
LLQVSAPSVLGYIPFAALDALFRVDPRFQRVYWRNFYMIVINWVKFSVPFLMYVLCCGRTYCIMRALMYVTFMGGCTLAVQ